MTPPISTVESNPREKEVSVTLMEELRRQGVFESEEESKTRCVRAVAPHIPRPSPVRRGSSGNEQTLTRAVARREIVLGRMAALVKKFVQRVSLTRGLSEAAAKAAGGKIYTFGSYRLGVHGPGTDIDTLVVVPRHVTREDFHGVLEGMLRETEGVTEVSVRTSHCSWMTGAQPRCRACRRRLSPSSRLKCLVSPSICCLLSSIYLQYRMIST